MNGILTILFKSRITRKIIFFEDALFSAKWHGTCATVNVSIETTKKKVKNKTNSKTVIKKFESVSSDRWQKTWINVRFTETRVVREYRISFSFFFLVTIFSVATLLYILPPKPLTTFYSVEAKKSGFLVYRRHT